jgi:hypothetical protein
MIKPLKHKFTQFKEEKKEKEELKLLLSQIAFYESSEICNKLKFQVILSVAGVFDLRIPGKRVVEGRRCTGKEKKRHHISTLKSIL